ncbi:Hypothetical predicted protein [Podarcis lilfordi]|nr:Hypothetical predicted protein [Podarcis lilfordi]
MRGPWLLFLIVGVTLVVSAISEAEVPATEGGPTSEDAPEKEEAHLERQQGARVAKAWWKKWIRESRKEEPPTPRPGMFGPLRNETDTVHCNTTATPGNGSQPVLPPSASASPH